MNYPRILLLSVAFFALLALPARSEATLFHVAPDGDDTALGAEDSPWRSIQHAAGRAQPGDTVLVHPGLYREFIALSRSGDALAPIVFRALPGVALLAPFESSFSAFDFSPGVGHLVIDGFAAVGYQEAFFLRPGSHHIALRNCVAVANQSGVWIASANAIEIDSCQLRGNRSAGMRIFGTSRDIVVRDTVSSDNDDELGCEGDADGFSVDESVSDVRFERCTAQANGEDGFDLQGDGIVLSAVESRANTCAGVKLYQRARLENALVALNRTGVSTTSFYGVATQIELMSSTVADNTGTQINLGRPLPGDAAQSSYSVTMRNLIAVGPGKAIEISRGVELSEDHNLFFRPDTTSAVIVLHLDSGGDVRYSGQAVNVGLWANDSGGGEGTWAIDPELASAADYRVAANSVAVDAGADEDAPGEDRRGTARPLGNAIDIGPDEIDPIVANHYPWADPGSDRTAFVGEEVFFSGVGSVDPDGQALTYEWDPGDASPPMEGPEVSHLYAAAGVYSARLTVSDGELQHSAIALVTVSPKETSEPLRDSSLRSVKPVRIRIPVRRGKRSKPLRVIVRSLFAADDEPFEISVRVDLGDCPPAILAGAPDFDRRAPGDQFSTSIEPGRRKAVSIPLEFSAEAFHTPSASEAQSCRLTVIASQDGGDANPADNAVAVDVQVLDPSDF